MIKRNHINTYKDKHIDNKVEYRTANGPYSTTNYVKILFSMPEFSNRKLSRTVFAIGNSEVNDGIGYAIIICHDLMVQLVMKANFGRQIL